MGGRSAEREVSLVSGRECAAGLGRGGLQGDHGRRTRRSQVVLKALEARSPTSSSTLCTAAMARTAPSRASSTRLGIPYTHSGVLASALAMDKTVAKRLFESAGLRCPAGQLVHRSAVEAGDVMPRPYVVKPNNEGSSVGVTIVRHGDNALPFAGMDWPFGDQVLVEPYIPGRELTVGVMGDRPLAVTELRPRQGFYDYTAKYTEGRTEHLVPAPVPPAVVRSGAAKRADCPSGAGLPRRLARRFPLRRQQRQSERALSAGSEYPARHDAAVAGARTGPLSRDPLQ